MSKETALLFWFPELSYHSRAVMLAYRKSFPLTKKFIYKKSVYTDMYNLSITTTFPTQ